MPACPRCSVWWLCPRAVSRPRQCSVPGRVPPSVRLRLIVTNTLIIIIILASYSLLTDTMISLSSSSYSLTQTDHHHLHRSRFLIPSCTQTLYHSRIFLLIRYHILSDAEAPLLVPRGSVPCISVCPYIMMYQHSSHTPTLSKHPPGYLSLYQPQAASTQDIEDILISGCEKTQRNKWLLMKRFDLIWR